MLKIIDYYLIVFSIDSLDSHSFWIDNIACDAKMITNAISNCVTQRCIRWEVYLIT